MSGLRLAPRRAAHGLIRAYQLSLSGVTGRQCRYLPTCSDYTDQAIRRHGLWAGGWMGTARLCRCHPPSLWAPRARDGRGADLPLSSLGRQGFRPAARTPPRRRQLDAALALRPMAFSLRRLTLPAQAFRSR